MTKESTSIAESEDNPVPFIGPKKKKIDRQDPELANKFISKIHSAVLYGKVKGLVEQNPEVSREWTSVEIFVDPERSRVGRIASTRPNRPKHESLDNNIVEILFNTDMGVSYQYEQGSAQEFFLQTLFVFTFDGEAENVNLIFSQVQENAVDSRGHNTRLFTYVNLSKEDFQQLQQSAQTNPWIYADINRRILPTIADPHNYPKTQLLILPHNQELLIHRYEDRQRIREQSEDEPLFLGKYYLYTSPEVFTLISQ